MKCVLTYLLVIIFISYASSCGVTQHNLIAHRAMNWFQPSLISGEYAIFLSIIQENQAAFQNGAAFPDWGYDCNFSDESEAAHWPPFTLAAADYIQNNCGGMPSNWTSHCQQLVSFFFGLVSHQIADVAWHDLDAVSHTKQGFIQTMADVNFEGDFGNAHTVADTGAEFIVAREFDLSFIQLEWYLPADDLATIYQKLRYNVTSEDISKCNTLLYAEVHAVKEGGALLYDYGAKRSPFLADQLLDFWIGGIDDNALWTQYCWSDYLMYWFSPDISGPTRNYPLCPVQYSMFSQCERCFTTRDRKLNRPFKQFVSNIVDSSNGIQLQYDDNGGVIFTHNNAFLQSLESSISSLSSSSSSPSSSSSSSKCTNGIMNNNTLTYNINLEYAYLGNTIGKGDLNEDGFDDLIIGAIGYGNQGTAEQGALFIIQGSSSFTNETIVLNTPSLIGLSSHDRFGESIVVLDFNLDGVNDLIVSAPTTSAFSLQYIGKVYVFFGDVNNANKFFSYQNISPQFANITFTSAYNYTNLGNKMIKADCNNDGFDDLIIGSPFSTKDGSLNQLQIGKVFVLFSSADHTSSLSSMEIETSADITIAGESESSWFGYHIGVGSNGNQPLLIISAPAFSSNPPSIGKIYAFNILTLSNIQNQNNYGDCLVFSISGENAFDQIGYSFDFGVYLTHNYSLAFSSPTYTPAVAIGNEQIGAVYITDISSLSGAITLNKLKTEVKLEGDEKYGRFGWDVKLVDLTGSGDHQLWVSQPRKKTDAGEESGAVYQWNALQNASKTNQPSESAEMCIYSNSDKGRFAQSVEFLDLNGDSVLDVVFSTPRYSSSLNGQLSVLLS